MYHRRYTHKIDIEALFFPPGLVFLFFSLTSSGRPDANIWNHVAPKSLPIDL
jgi:hypothetical protein